MDEGRVVTCDHSLVRISMGRPPPRVRISGIQVFGEKYIVTHGYSCLKLELGIPKVVGMSREGGDIDVGGGAVQAVPLIAPPGLVWGTVAHLKSVVY